MPALVHLIPIKFEQALATSLNLLDASAIKTISSNDLQKISLDQFTQLNGSFFNSLNPDELKKLGPEFFKNVNPDEIKILDTNFIRNIDPAVIKTLGTDFFKNVNQKVLRELGADFFREFPEEIIKILPDDIKFTTEPKFKISESGLLDKTKLNNDNLKFEAFDDFKWRDNTTLNKYDFFKLDKDAQKKYFEFLADKMNTITVHVSKNPFTKVEDYKAYLLEVIEKSQSIEMLKQLQLKKIAEETVVSKLNIVKFQPSFVDGANEFLTTQVKNGVDLKDAIKNLENMLQSKVIALDNYYKDKQIVSAPDIILNAPPARTRLLSNEVKKFIISPETNFNPSELAKVETRALSGDYKKETTEILSKTTNEGDGKTLEETIDGAARNASIDKKSVEYKEECTKQTVSEGLKNINNNNPVLTTAITQVNQIAQNLVNQKIIPAGVNSAKATAEAKAKATTKELFTNSQLSNRVPDGSGSAPDAVKDAPVKDAPVKDPDAVTDAPVKDAPVKDPDAVTDVSTTVDGATDAVKKLVDEITLVDDVKNVQDVVEKTITKGYIQTTYDSVKKALQSVSSKLKKGMTKEKIAALFVAAGITVGITAIINAAQRAVDEKKANTLKVISIENDPNINNVVIVTYSPGGLICKNDTVAFNNLSPSPEQLTNKSFNVIDASFNSKFSINVDSRIPVRVTSGSFLVNGDVAMNVKCQIDDAVGPLDSFNWFFWVKIIAGILLVLFLLYKFSGKGQTSGTKYIEVKNM